MRRHWIFIAALWAGASSAFAAEGIVAVLERSHAIRLERMKVAEPAGARAGAVRASFETLMRALPLPYPSELRVIEGETVAETLQGRTIVANESLADLPEGERIFILAHEIGHVELRHWEQTEQLYLKWVPGAVTPDRTDPVATSLGRDASGLAHRQELEADAFALRALHLLGLSSDVAVDAFKRAGMNQDTATHPGTRKRLAALRAAEAAEAGEAPVAGPPALAALAHATTRNDPIDSVRRPD